MKCGMPLPRHIEYQAHSNMIPHGTIRFQTTRTVLAGLFQASIEQDGRAVNEEIYEYSGNNIEHHDNGDKVGIQ